MDTREALLNAAEWVILEDGFARASTRRIAAQADVPLSLLHYHFGGKESLLISLVERRRDRNRDAVVAALARAEDSVEGGRAALAAARRAFLDDESGMRLLVEMSVAALHNPRLRAELGRLYAETMASLRRVRAPAAEPEPERAAHERLSETVASLVLATGLGLALQRMLGMSREVAESAFDILASLLLAEAERSLERERGRPG